MEPRPDRLRELLDAVLDEEHDDLDAMAAGAHASPFHFSRQLRRGAGEPPVAMRRRVMLERAAWQLARGSSVTDAAFAAGYESVEGFARAFGRSYGHAPSATPTEPRSHWLPAPNGVHFHPPTSLWVDAQGQAARAANPLAQLLVEHDLDDTAHLLDLVTGLPEEEYRRVRAPGHVLLEWDGEETSIAGVLDHLVRSREVWLASLLGHDAPGHGSDDVVSLVARHAAVAPAWLAAWCDVDRRGAWDDALVDALCDPPQTFRVAAVLAHVVTFCAHRRQLARTWLRAARDEAVDDGDPITWEQTRVGNEAREDRGARR